MKLEDLTNLFFHLILLSQPQNIIESRIIAYPFGVERSSQSSTSLQNKPNPFNRLTEIYYNVKEGSHIRLEIYDITGSLVKTLVNEEQSLGNYSIIWDGKNYNGKNVPNGIYFYKLTSGDFTTTKKLVLIR